MSYTRDLSAFLRRASDAMRDTSDSMRDDMRDDPAHPPVVTGDTPILNWAVFFVLEVPAGTSIPSAATPRPEDMPKGALAGIVIVQYDRQAQPPSRRLKGLRSKTQPEPVGHNSPRHGEIIPAAGEK